MNHFLGLASSHEIAKERLHFILEREHQNVDDETMEKIQNEVAVLVTKYIDISPENIEVKIILKDYKRHRI